MLSNTEDTTILVNFHGLQIILIGKNQWRTIRLIFHDLEVLVQKVMAFTMVTKNCTVNRSKRNFYDAAHWLYENQDYSGKWPIAVEKELEDYPTVSINISIASAF